MIVTDEIEDLVDAASAAIEALAYPDCTDDVAGMMCESAGESLRAAAISELLINGDADRFYHGLMNSARVSRYYLTRSQRAGHSDFRCAASRTDGLLDALAAADFKTATEIAALSPDLWMKDDEYEDEFLFASFIHQSLGTTPDVSNVDELFRRMNEAGGSSAKRELCSALHEARQELFDSAFEVLLEERVASIARDRELFESTIVLETSARVYIEGLAVLRLAERAGLKTQREYLFCPEIARSPMIEPFAEDQYPELNI